MKDPGLRLREAVISGCLPIAKRLLARFPELWLNTDPDNNGWCNLHYAAYHGNYLVCFHLLSMRPRLSSHSAPAVCELDLVTFDNLTLLHMPLFHRHSQTLHYLLQEFSSHHWLNQGGGEYHRTPLHYCCTTGFPDGLKLLLEFGADWRVQDANGDTCLHLCFAYGDPDCLAELIKSIVMQKVSSLHANPAFSGAPASSAAEAVENELSWYEKIKNNSGFRAIDYSSSFELQNFYKSCRSEWIQSAVAEEGALRKQGIWDTSSLFALATATKEASSQSSGSSIALNDADPFNSRTSIDAGITPSPKHSEKAESVEISTPLLSDAVFVPGRSRTATAAANEPFEQPPSKTTSSPSTSGRTHSKSLGNENTHPALLIDTRKRANTSIVHSSAKPPTHSSVASSRAPNFAKFPSPLTPLLTEFPRTPSLKSITILPLVRGSKRRTSTSASAAEAAHSVNEALSENPPPMLPPNSIQLPSLSSSAKSASLHFLPVGGNRRRESTSSSIPSISLVSNKSTQPTSPFENSSKLPSPTKMSRRASLNRHVSTPSVNSYGSSSRVLRKSSHSDPSLPKKASVKSFEEESNDEDISTSLDTINLSNVENKNLDEEEDSVHSFVARIPEIKSLKFEVYPSLAEREALAHPRAYLHDNNSSLSLLTRRDESLTTLTRNLSSISFNRVRE